MLVFAAHLVARRVGDAVKCESEIHKMKITEVFGKSSVLVFVAHPVERRVGGAVKCE